MSSKKDELNLKGPDAFQVRAAESVEYLKANSKLVVGLISLVAISAVAVIGFNYFKGQQVLERQQAISQVDQMFEKEAKAFGDEKSKLEKELDDLKLANKDKPSAESDAKIKALEDSIEGLSKPDHSGSMEAYRRAYQEYKESPQGMVAGIHYASLAVESGKLADAKDVLIQVAKSSTNYAILHAQSGMLLLSVLEDLGQYDEALLQVDSLLKTAGKELQPRVLLAKGRIQYLSKDLTGARATFDELISKHESAQETEKARSLKALLN